MILVWFGALGALAAYAVHLMLAPPLVATACEYGRWIPLALLVILPLAVGVVAGLVSFRGWRTDPPADGEAVDDVIHFLHGVGVILSVFFVTLMVLGSVPILFLDPCL